MLEKPSSYYDQLAVYGILCCKKQISHAFASSSAVTTGGWKLRFLCFPAGKLAHKEPEVIVQVGWLLRRNPEQYSTTYMHAN